MRQILAIDTGGTKTLMVAFDEDGNPLHEVKYPTPKDPAEYIRKLADTTRQEFAVDEIVAISIATPGYIENGVVKDYDKLEWQDFHLVEQISAEFPSTEVTLLNDAKLGALGVTTEVESNRMMYLTLSTGINMGMMINEQISNELVHSEIGKITLTIDDKTDIWENFASGQAFVATHGKYGDEIDDEETWRNYAEKVGAGLSASLSILQPDTIVIGGSMAHHVDKYLPYLREIIARDVWPSYQNIQIAAAQDPDRAVIYGCYRYAKEQSSAK